MSSAILPLKSFGSPVDCQSPLDPPSHPRLPAGCPTVTDRLAPMTMTATPTAAAAITAPPPTTPNCLMLAGFSLLRVEGRSGDDGRHPAGDRGRCTAGKFDDRIAIQLGPPARVAVHPAQQVVDQIRSTRGRRDQQSSLAVEHHLQRGRTWRPDQESVSRVDCRASPGP